jgi:flagellar basal body-associated protein FliL
MTYPPQQPDPYGAQRRRPGPYGQQPPPRPHPYGQPPQPPPPPPPPQLEPFAGQPGYVGLGSYSDEEPDEPSPPPPPPQRPSKPSGPGKIIAIVVVAVLLLGGAGAGVWFLTKGDKGQNSASSDNKPGNPAPGGQDDSGGTTTTASGSADPAAVQRAYILAYQTKQFAPVLNSACDAYKKKFGTSTTELDKQLAPYDRITAEADGQPEVTGNSATAKINLELTRGTEIRHPKIKIKIVKESGSWKFCGEGQP